MESMQREFLALSAVLASAHPGTVAFFCKGCNAPHMINIGTGPGPRWGFNGNHEKPTFTPSIKVSWPANPDATEEFKEWRTERVCHSFVTDGRIQYLGDCTHELAGQTVDLALWDESWEAW